MTVKITRLQRLHFLITEFRKGSVCVPLNAKQHEVLKAEIGLVLQQWTALNLAGFRQN